MTSLLSGQAAGSLTLAIVGEVADLEGADPLDLEPPLHEIVDPDALEALFADSIDGTVREDVAVEFHYCGYRVLVDAGGVHVEDASVAREPPVDE